MKAIKKFKKNKKKTIALVEHWTNYKSRFNLKNDYILPDKIWVFDKFAKEKMIKTFATKVVLKKNFYIEDIKKKINKIKKNTNISHILYVSEPVSEFLKKKIKNYKFLKEYKSFKYFYNNLKYLTKKKYIINFRLHPTEKINKYKWLKTIDNKIKISKNSSLMQDIIKADIVIGRQTMALVVALKAGKKVFSCIPDNEKRCVIPYKGIVELRDLLK